MLIHRYIIKKSRIFTTIVQLLLLFLLQTATGVHGIYWKLRVLLEDYLLQEECFAKGCGQPSLRIVLREYPPAAAANIIGPDGGPSSTSGDSSYLSERTIGWPISVENLNLINSGGHPPNWDSIFTVDEAQNLSLTTEISGIDSLYNFPRICDTSSSTTGEGSDALVSIAKEFSGVHPLSGKCFNATLRVIWSCCGYDCPAGAIYDCCDMEDGGGGVSSLAKDSKTPQNVPSVAFAGPLQGFVPSWIALVLGISAVIFFATALLLLTAYLNRGKKSSRKCPVVSSKYPSSHSRLGRSSSQDSGKYDVPWDQKFRPLPDYVRNQLDPHATVRDSSSLQQQPYADDELVHGTVGGTLMNTNGGPTFPSNNNKNNGNGNGHYSQQHSHPRFHPNPLVNTELKLDGYID